MPTNSLLMERTDSHTLSMFELGMLTLHTSHSRHASVCSHYNQHETWLDTCFCITDLAYLIYKQLHGIHLVSEIWYWFWWLIHEVLCVCVCSTNVVKYSHQKKEHVLVGSDSAQLCVENEIKPLSNILSGHFNISQCSELRLQSSSCPSKK